MLDLILDLNKGINLVYGESATGKTTLCLQIAGDEAKNGKVVFLDTENGFSLERFVQMYSEDYKERLNNVILIRIPGFEEQCRIFETLRNMKKIRLVIIDTIGMHYRQEVRKDHYATNKKIDRQLQILKELSKREVKVIVSNQVYSNIDTKKLQVVGGNMLKNWSSVVIRMEKEPRKIIREKPESAVNSFKISNKGIELL